jgi:membrane associated rhomboid family serine protease
VPEARVLGRQGRAQLAGAGEPRYGRRQDGNGWFMVMQRREPVFNVPAGVVGTLAAIVLIHIVRGFLPEELDIELLWTLAFVPARYGGTAAVIADIPGGDIAAVTSFVSYMFVHGDVTHLVVNGIWLLAFGSAVAKRVGNSRFLLFSLACGIAGALTHLAVYFGDVRPVVGASAAISGQMAAALRFMMSGRGHISYSPESLAAIPLAPIGQTLRNPRILFIVALWAAINLLFGLGYSGLEGEAAIAWEAHVGGFLFGLLGFGLFDRHNSPPPKEAPLP